MKKVFILISAISITITSCDKSSSSKNEEVNSRITSPKEKSFQNTSLIGYKGQLPYIKSQTQEEIAEQNATLDLGNKVTDSKFDWKYFDKQYSDDLTESQKQNLSYIILSTKDLIQLSMDKPNDEILKNAIIKYTKILVETKYIGYCLLYNSLENIENKKLVTELANSISKYSKEETFHKHNIDNIEIQNTTIHTKIKEDYSYLEKIKALSSVK